MSVTHYHTDESRLVRGRAYAYGQRGADLRLDTPSNERAGAGGVFTNVRDLLQWDENFYTGRVGGRTLLEELQKPGRLNNGRVLTYAWGLQIGRYRGLRIVEHGGSLGGYRAHLLRFPDQHFSVAALCNLGSIAPGNLARQVADVTFGNQLTEPAAPQPPAGTGGGGRAIQSARSRPSFSVASVGEYPGAYFSDEVDAIFTVDERAGGLTLRRDGDGEAAVLEPNGIDEFRFRGMTIRFERGADRKIVALLVDAGRVRDIRFVRQAR
jgi:hypothetical protein